MKQTRARADTVESDKCVNGVPEGNERTCKSDFEEREEHAQKLLKDIKPQIQEALGFQSRTNKTCPYAFKCRIREELLLQRNSVCIYS